MTLQVGDEFKLVDGQVEKKVIINGLASINETLPEGRVIVPKSPETELDVSKYDNFSCEWYHGTLSIRKLRKQYDKVEQ